MAQPTDPKSGEGKPKPGAKRDPRKEHDDRKPAPDVVGDFHANSDVDAHAQALHHTLGFGSGQASPGDHGHNANDPGSLPLWTGVSLNDPAANASNADLAAAISALNALIRQKATG